MKWKHWMFRCLILAAIVIGNLSMAGANFYSSKEGEAAYQRMRRVAPLKAAGIDPASTEALIKALTHENVGVQLAAMDFLMERKEQAAIPELRKLLQARPDTFRESLRWNSGFQLKVCEALAALGEKSETWKPVCVQLLEDRTWYIQLDAAGLLAKHGDPRGWELVKQNLVHDKSSYVLRASSVAPAFDGLEIETEKGRAKINIFEEALQAFAKNDESSQVFLVQMILFKVAKPEDIPRLRELMLLVKAEEPYTKSVLGRLIGSLEMQKMFGYFSKYFGESDAASQAKLLDNVTKFARPQYIPWLKELLPAAKSEQNKAKLLAIIKDLESQQKTR